MPRLDIEAIPEELRVKYYIDLTHVMNPDARNAFNNFRWALTRDPDQQQARFNTNVCPQNGHPVTLFPGGFAWCKGTSNALWRVGHGSGGSNNFRWYSIGRTMEPDLDSVHEAMQAFIECSQAGVITGGNP